nr:jacalin-related lectin 24-like [Nicotiana tomentosiformis]
MDMIKVGPVGGQAGSFWDEKGRDQVAGIFVSYSKDAVESLQFLFYESGNIVLSNKHGVFYQSQNFYAVVFDYLSVSYFDKRLSRKTEPMENRRLFGGFHGSENGSGVESIGIYVKPIISSMINLSIHE